MTLQKTGKVDKGWGFEIVFASNDKYCGKLLVFKKTGAKTSLVMHKEKAKSWFVNAGKFKITFVDIKDGSTKEAIIGEGQTAEFHQLAPHQIECLEEGGIIFEVGTADNVEDRFRLAPGDSQKLNAEQQPNPQS